jgi:transcriptional regulator with XRE-family HTH domain
MTTTQKTRPVARQAIADQVRRLVSERGISGFALAKATGIARSNVNRFLRGETGLTLDSFERVAEVLGLRVVESGRRLNKQVKPRSADRAPVRPELLAPVVERVEPEVE